MPDVLAEEVLTAERRQMMAVVRAFVEKEVIPLATRIEGDEAALRNLLETMKKLGLFGVPVPEAYGGLGLDHTTCALIAEELARGWVSLAGVLGEHWSTAAVIAMFGTAAQKTRYLPAMVTGDQCGALCFAESPEPGFHAIRTMARRGAGGYLLNGSKSFVANGRQGMLFLVLAKTDPEATPPEAGMSCFLVEPGEPGLRVTKRIDRLGDKGVELVELHFDQLPVPHEDLLGGEEGQGFKQAMAAVELRRLNDSARAVGVAEAALQTSLRYAQIRRTFGKPIAEHQAIQLKMADMATKTEAARRLTYAAASRKDVGAPAELEVRMATLFASEAAQEVALDAMRIHGGYGYIKESPIERYYRDVPHLAQGMGDMQRIAIARCLFERYAARQGGLKLLDDLPEERRRLVGAVRAFVEHDVVPVASMYELADEYPGELVERLKALGLLGATIPREYGGLGLDFSTYALIVEELSRGWMSLTGVLNTHLIMAYLVLQFGTAEQRRRFLPVFATGAKRGGLALTEPEAGSDVQAIRTQARRDGDHYVITGTKMFVTNGR
ncbi:MAG TPA: acyl-CoA dehydrogenase family protein, partial [Thermoleophilia bacterium]|nr:acyl-CoA dehydrogenase family protein [Thermoleophilia bacterium]